LDRHFNSGAALTGAVVSGVGLLGLPQTSHASIVAFGPTTILIPITAAGVYLNVVTGVNGTSPASVSGWDINPFSASVLNFFNPIGPAGGVYVVGLGSSATQVDNLSLGTLIDSTSAFGSGAVELTGATAYVLNSDDNFFGFRFHNETAGNQTQYGWFQVHLGSTLTTPDRAIIAYAYENSGAGILVGAGAVPEASTTTAGVLGLLAAGALGLRRRRAA